MIKWLPVLLISVVACSRPYTITASLHNTRWYGTGQAQQALTRQNEACLIKRFSVGARTDIPYSKASLTATKPTGCAEDCLPTQWLDFYNIPLQKGKYNLTLADSCLPSNVGRAQLLVEEFSIKTSYQFSADDRGWFEVVQYNPVTGLIRGKFELTLTNSNGQTIHLKKGKVNGTLINDR